MPSQATPWDTHLSLIMLKRLTITKWIKLTLQPCEVTLFVTSFGNLPHLVLKFLFCMYMLFACMHVYRVPRRALGPPRTVSDGNPCRFSKKAASVLTPEHLPSPTATDINIPSPASFKFMFVCLSHPLYTTYLCLYFQIVGDCVFTKLVHSAF